MESRAGEISQNETEREIRMMEGKKGRRSDSRKQMPGDNSVYNIQWLLQKYRRKKGDEEEKVRCNFDTYAFVI